MDGRRMGEEGQEVGSEGGRGGRSGEGRRVRGRMGRRGGREGGREMQCNAAHCNAAETERDAMQCTALRCNATQQDTGGPPNWPEELGGGALPPNHVIHSFLVFGSGRPRNTAIHIFFVFRRATNLARRAWGTSMATKPYYSQVFCFFGPRTTRHCDSQFSLWLSGVPQTWPGGLG